MASNDNSNTHSPQKPKSNKEKGDWGEEYAAQHLIMLGCAVRERKWKGHGYEIDLIAQKGDRMIFVEVKMRSPKDSQPVDAVNRKKRERIIKGADIYLKGLDTPFKYQFDIIAIVGTPPNVKLHHIPDAYFPSPKSRRLFEH